MAATDQSIRVSARGEFGQLQRGLKDLQGDFKGLLGEIDKGARRGGIFDDTQLRALNIYKSRFKETMEGIDREFKKQNDIIDQLHEKMRKASFLDRQEIAEQIKAKEKELDVIRKQLIETERLYSKRNQESKNYEILPTKNSGGGSGGSIGSSLAPGAIGGIFSKAIGAATQVTKFAMGLAGISSLMSMASEAYQQAYQRQVNSLDLAQRLRGNGFSGSAVGMYDQASEVGRRDRMGYTQAQSWALQDAYTSRAGTLGPDGQFSLQKFSRGYGLDATEVGGLVGEVKQSGGVSKPKQFADMIAGSVSQSGMIPRIYEVMQAHTGLLHNLNTSFKDGSSAQILAYQTALDKIGNAKGMTRLTGAQGANVLGGLGGIFDSNNDKWKWTGVAALQHYDPKKYGNMGLYELESNFEDGMLNPDNLPAMSKYLKERSGNNNTVFKRLMQSWLQDGGFNASKSQVTELDRATEGFTVFDKDKVSAIMNSNSNTDSGAKYSSERQGEYGQGMMATDAALSKQLEGIGDKFLPLVQQMKSDFTDILQNVNEDKGFKPVVDSIDKFLKNSNIDKLLAAIILLKGGGLIWNLGKGLGKGIYKVGKYGNNARKGGGKGPDIDPGGGGGSLGGDKNTKRKKSGGGTMDDVDARIEELKQKQGRVKDPKLINRDLTKAEKSKLDKLSGGDKVKREALEEHYRVNGSMKKTETFAKGKFSSAERELLDELSGGDTKKRKALEEHYKKTGNLDSVADQAEKITTKKPGFFGKVGEKFKGAGGFSGVSKAAGKGILKGSGSFLKGAGKAGLSLLKKIPVAGALLDFGVNKLMGDSTGRAGSRAAGSMLGGFGGGAIGSGVGALIGGGIGALFGGVGAVPGAAIGAHIGGGIGAIGGGILGDRAGAKTYEFFTGKSDKATEEAASQLMQFASKGQLDLDGLSSQGVQKLEEMKNNGLLQFTSLNTSSSATLTSMTDQGKQSLLKLQQDGLVSIGGLQKDGSTKLTALNDDGKKALQELNKEGLIKIGDFQTTGKVRITNLSEEGAKQLLDLQKNGSGTLTSMGVDTSKKLQDIKKDTGTKMDDIYKEHKGLKEKIADIFEPLTKKIGDWFSGFWDKLKTFLNIGNSNTGSMGPGGATINSDVRNISNVTADQLNSKLKGKLKGYGQDFIDAGKQYGIDPAFLAAISMHETGNGSVLNYNNVAGMMKNGGKSLMVFNSMRDGIFAEAANLKSLYINEGLTTPAAIQKKYCPVGAANDPNNLNQYWLNTVTGYWKDLGGGGPVAGAGGKAGGPIFNGWKLHINSQFGVGRGDHNHGGLDLAALQGTEINALAGGKISFINIDDGGRYDEDGRANTRAGGSELGVKMADGRTYFFSHLSQINPDILDKWESGNHDISVDAGQWLARSGGNVGVPGSGYSTTGNHLHFGYMNADGSLLNPSQLLDSLGIGDSDIGRYKGAQNSNNVKEVKVTVDVNIKGEGASQLNNMTLAALRNMVQQIVAEQERQKLAMNTSILGV